MSDPSPWTDTAAAGVRSTDLAALLRDHWEWTMRESPTWATSLGDRRFDDRLADGSRAAVLRRRQERRAFLSRARAIDPTALAPEDEVTLSLLVESLQAAIAVEACEHDLWTVVAYSNPIGTHSRLPRLHTVQSAEEARTLILRYRAVPRAIDDEIAGLSLGLSRGLVANAETVRRVVAIARAQLEQPWEEWELLAPLRADPPFPGDARALQAAVQGEIAPAFRRYADFLETRVLPRARGIEAGEGLVGLQLGPACYAASILEHTGLHRTPDEIHALGLSEIARVEDEMRALGERLFGTRELPAILSRLRTDRALYFATEEEVESAATSALATARAAIPRFFGRLPRADCVVVRVPEVEAPFTTIAYYQSPHADGSKPGEYFVNTTAPETRPRFEARVLAVHEAIPGHHLQIAIAQELGELPAFRRHASLTAYAEGWALYTERLADEMGLYESDLDRMGMLSFDAWRAARLVVDTGVHALGWTRAEAVQYMLDHTALTPGNIDNEVDRYLAWPGQALAYRVGQIEILRLRRESEAALGDRFDLRAFHDVVLGGGAVSLGVLQARVEAWIAASRSDRTDQERPR